MPPCNRRVFGRYLAAGGLLAARVLAVEGENLDRVTENDPSARSQGFRTDTARVDDTRYPLHDAAQHCGVCRLFGGGDGATLGPCSFYGGRLVPSRGWCRNFKPAVGR